MGISFVSLISFCGLSVVTLDTNPPLNVLDIVKVIQALASRNSMIVNFVEPLQWSLLGVLVPGFGEINPA